VLVGLLYEKARKSAQILRKKYSSGLLQPITFPHILLSHILVLLGREWLFFPSGGRVRWKGGMKWRSDDTPERSSEERGEGNAWGGCMRKQGGEMARVVARLMVHRRALRTR
jgi:hypothetical protein